MNFYDKFINWLDSKLKLNRLLSAIIGITLIILGFYISKNIITHTVKNSTLCFIIYIIFVIVGVLFLTLAKFGKDWKK